MQVQQLLQTTGNTSLNSIDTKTPALSGGRVPVESNLVQGLTDSQRVLQFLLIKSFRFLLTCGTFWQATQPVSAVSLPLPTDASTSALQTTGNSSLSSIDAKTPSLSSGRVPVENNLVQGLTDTQLRASAVPVSLSSSPLPTGAATESTLAALNNKFNTNSFSNINTNTTTTVKSGAGVLKRIVVNKVGALSNTCTIYDNTTATGTIIGTIDLFHTQMVFEYDVVLTQD